MKAAWLNQFGSADVVSQGEIALRALNADEVIVRVEAAGLNPLDLKIMAGYMQAVFPVEFPYVPGTDFSGVVESAGAAVTTLRPGDRVFGRTAPSSGGAFAQRVVIAANDVSIMPASMSFEHAAALPTAFGTAYQSLFEVGRLQRGERVLIHAAAGGVGSMAVQLAHRAGACVIATASARNHELVKSLGADRVIDYRAEDFSALRDVDLVLDTLGGETLEQSWSVLRAGGRIVSMVEFGIQPRDGRDGASVFFATAQPFLAKAVERYEADELQIIIDEIFAPGEARAALEKLATGHARGKIVIRASHGAWGQPAGDGS
ncbi:NADP-dependent oxidoreductase [Paraburkholderia acidisoli]|uniref:Zinc-binding dehydrogenase n=1 Tax=Paraburkholderia acidisoli TaxID=2571748 RepID=A0A7Z2JK73_9BURK|nr:NADP-dependent oxidoreductase [Paraburkholderia acidisoli]QGZ66024.1 zinc-binding dehydrogenase [Paraburkholderia acidisoli]